MRLIDADELKKWLKSPVGFRANCEDCTSIDCLNCIIEEAIDNAPTVEAVVLPCKIGDEFWTEWVGIRSVKCSMLTQKADGSWQGRFTVAAMGGAGITVSLGEIEKRLFRTRAEAEAALAKMKGGADNV